MSKNQKNKKQSKKPASTMHSTYTYEKPTVEACSAGIPLSIGLLPDDTDTTGDNSPTLVDHEMFGRVYPVRDEIYTIRLGIHSDPCGIGAIPQNSAVACIIPTVATKRAQLSAMFFIDELNPAKFMDCVYLVSDKAFRLEYIPQSARLESNNESRSHLTLDDDAVSLKQDHILIYFNELNSELPQECNFTYDFLTFQVKVSFENKYIAVQRARIANKPCQIWQEHEIKAAGGDLIEIETSFINNGSETITNLIVTTDIPDCFRFVKGSITTDGARHPMEVIKKKDYDLILNISLGECKPGPVVCVRYAIEVLNTDLPAGRNGFCNWVKISSGSETLQYAHLDIFLK